MIDQSFTCSEICDDGSFHFRGFFVRAGKSDLIARKAAAIARTLHANKRDDVVTTFSWNSHTTIAKGEVQRFEGRLIAEDGDGRRVTEEI